jgi:hypothetical protein
MALVLRAVLPTQAVRRRPEAQSQLVVFRPLAGQLEPLQ